MLKKLIVIFCVIVSIVSIAEATPIYFKFETTGVASSQDFILDDPIGLVYSVIFDFDIDGTSTSLDGTIHIQPDRRFIRDYVVIEYDHFYADLPKGKNVTGNDVETDFQTYQYISNNYGLILSKEYTDPTVDDYYQFSFHSGSAYEYLTIWQDNNAGVTAFNLDIGSTWNIQDGYYDYDGLFHYIEFHSTLTVISTTAPVPEPSTIILLGTGIFGLIGYRRRTNAT